MARHRAPQFQRSSTVRGARANACIVRRGRASSQVQFAGRVLSIAPRPAPSRSRPSPVVRWRMDPLWPSLHPTAHLPSPAYRPSPIAHRPSPIAALRAVALRLRARGLCVTGFDAALPSVRTLLFITPHPVHAVVARDGGTPGEHGGGAVLGRGGAPDAGDAGRRTRAWEARGCARRPSLPGSPAAQP